MKTVGPATAGQTLRAKALEQLLDETNWRDLDVLVIDLPQGTGDEVLMIKRTLRMTGSKHNGSGDDVQ